jgi:hypothetical protein
MGAILAAQEGDAMQDEAYRLGYALATGLLEHPVVVFPIVIAVALAMIVVSQWGQ